MKSLKQNNDSVKQLHRNNQNAKSQECINQCNNCPGLRIAGKNFELFFYTYGISVDKSFEEIINWNGVDNTKPEKWDGKVRLVGGCGIICFIKMHAIFTEDSILNFIQLNRCRALQQDIVVGDSIFIVSGKEKLVAEEYGGQHDKNNQVI